MFISHVFSHLKRSWAGPSDVRARKVAHVKLYRPYEPCQILRYLTRREALLQASAAHRPMLQSFTVQDLDNGQVDDLLGCSSES